MPRETSIAVHRGNIHNRATTALQHRANRLLSTEEISLDVEIEHFIIDLFGHIEEAVGTRYARIIDQDIQPAKSARYLIDYAQTIANLLKIALYRYSLPAQALDLGHGF